MKTTLETKTAAVAAVPANSTLVILAAVVDGAPTAAQIETARYSVEANLENVGATATSAYLTRFEPVALNVDADEGLLLEVAASLSKVAPDSLPEIVDETSPEESASSEAETPLENDAASFDETTLDENAAAIDATEIPEA